MSSLACSFRFSVPTVITVTPCQNCAQVWAVLKPGFLAFLEDPFDTKPLDIIVFDVLPASDGNGEGRVALAKEIKDRNPLRHAFKVMSHVYGQLFC